METKAKASLINALRTGVSKRLSSGLIIIGLISVGLHCSWSLRQKMTMEDQIRDAVAHTLQNPIRDFDWIAIKRTLQAFSASSNGADICVKLPDSTILEHPNCDTPKFKKYPLRLSDETFEVSVKISVLDSMVLVGLPFLMTSLILAFITSRFFRNLSSKIESDLRNLADDNTEQNFHYLELENAQEKIKESLRIKSDALVGSVATQVAHDIRSPLEVLKNLRNELSSLPESTKIRTSMSIRRIEEIANSLLNLNRTSFEVIEENKEVINLNEILNEIYDSKAIEVSENNNIKLVKKFVNTTPYAFSIFPQITFKNILSNLINNAVEALPAIGGTVSINLSYKNGFNVIEITDTGSGIPQEIQNQLFVKGFTTKTNGNGLGLFNAKLEIEKYNGILSYETPEEKGCTFKISLPAFQNIQRCRDNPTLILIDNDKLIRFDWQVYYQKLNINFRSFPSIQEFCLEKENIPYNSYIFVDSNLADEVKGEIESEVIANLGYKNIFLTTGYQKDQLTIPPWIREVFGKNPRNIHFPI